MFDRTSDIVIDGSTIGELRYAAARSKHKKRWFVLVLGENSKWSGYALTAVQNFLEYAGEFYQTVNPVKKKRFVYFTVHRNGDIDAALKRAKRYLENNLRPVVSTTAPQVAQVVGLHNRKK